MNITQTEIAAAKAECFASGGIVTMLPAQPELCRPGTPQTLWLRFGWWSLIEMMGWVDTGESR